MPHASNRGSGSPRGSPGDPLPPGEQGQDLGTEPGDVLLDGGRLATALNHADAAAVAASTSSSDWPGNRGASKNTPTRIPYCRSKPLRAPVIDRASARIAAAMLAMLVSVLPSIRCPFLSGVPE
jgi:hypothetical protein